MAFCVHMASRPYDVASAWRRVLMALRPHGVHMASRPYGVHMASRPHGVEAYGGEDGGWRVMLCNGVQDVSCADKCCRCHEDTAMRTPPIRSEMDTAMRTPSVSTNMGIAMRTLPASSAAVTSRCLNSPPKREVAKYSGQHRASDCQVRRRKVALAPWCTRWEQSCKASSAAAAAAAAEEEEQDEEESKKNEDGEKGALADTGAVEVALGNKCDKKPCLPAV
eukprot:358050-Chlamydomonas_euryale.AAC.4